jgi:hypothetical protein
MGVQIPLFHGLTPAPSVTAPCTPKGGLPSRPTEASAAEPLPVSAPVEQLRRLDAELAAAGPPLVPGAPLSPLHQAAPRHRAAGLPSVLAAEAAQKAAQERQDAAARALAPLIADAQLDGEELPVVVRLAASVLPDDRLWLEVLVEVLGAELAAAYDARAPYIPPLPALLKAVLTRGRAAGLAAGIAMDARSRFFHALRQVSPAPSFSAIAEVWGCRDHTMPANGFHRHARRLARAEIAALGPAELSPAVEEIRRWVEHDTDPPPSSAEGRSVRRTG